MCCIFYKIIDTHEEVQANEQQMISMDTTLEKSSEELTCESTNTLSISPGLYDTYSNFSATDSGFCTSDFYKCETSYSAADSTASTSDSYYLNYSPPNNELQFLNIDSHGEGNISEEKITDYTVVEHLNTDDDDHSLFDTDEELLLDDDLSNNGDYVDSEDSMDEIVEADTSMISIDDFNNVDPSQLCVLAYVAGKYVFVQCIII